MYAEKKYNAQYGTWITKGSPFLEEPAAEVRSYSVGEYINRARDIPDPDNYEDCRYYDYDDYEPAQPSDEEIEASLDEQYREQLNTDRDEKGRLKKGAKIAGKRSCDGTDIWWLYSERNYSVKEIVELKGCSKSTVYNVIKKHKERGEAKQGV